MAKTSAEKLSLAHLLGSEYNNTQKELILAPEFEIAAVTGMGAGKTYALCVAVFRHCMKFPGANALISRLTFRELIDSTKRQFFELVDSKDLSEFIVLPKRWDYREGTNMVRFVNGSEITFANLEPGRLDKLKNIEYSYIGIDQAEEIGFDTYQILLLRCRLNAVPGKERKIVSIANDEGDNWLRRRFLTFEQPHGRPTAKNTRRLLRSSSLENPHLDEATRSLYLSMPESIRARYVYATMDAGSTRLIPDFRVIDGFEPPAHWPRWLGVDPARSTGVTCAIWISVNPDTIEYKGVPPNAPFIYREYWADGREAETHAEAIAAATGPYPCRGRVMDHSAWASTSLSKKSGSTSVAQLYINAGLGVAPSNGDEWARVSLFLQAQTRGLVVAADCHNLRRQGPEYRVRGQAVFDHTGSAKNLKIVGKQHFHTVDAAGYALSIIPTRITPNDLTQITDVYRISDKLDLHSRKHWEADLARFPKMKGRESIITAGLDDDFQAEEVPLSWAREVNEGALDY